MTQESVDRVFSDASALVGAAEQCESASEADQLYRKAIDRLQPWAQLPTETRIAYLLGYCWYNISDSSQERISKADEYLRYAIASDSTHQLARCYLAHLLFDTKMLVEAKTLLDQVPPRYFSQRQQRWRDLKIMELRVCCELYLNNWCAGLDQLRWLKVGLREAASDDLPKPIELERAWHESQANVGDSRKRASFDADIAEVLRAYRRVTN